MPGRAHNGSRSTRRPDSAGQLLERAAKAAAEHGVEQPETVEPMGNAAERILEQAREGGADTIVMGSRGLSDLEGMLVGSVSHEVGHVFDGAVITVQ